MPTKIISLGPWLPELGEHNNPGLISARGWNPWPTGGYRPYGYFVRGNQTNLEGRCRGMHIHIWRGQAEAYYAADLGTASKIWKVPLTRGDPSTSAAAFGAPVDVTASSPWGAFTMPDTGIRFCTFGRFVVVCAEGFDPMFRDSTGSSAFQYLFAGIFLDAAAAVDKGGGKVGIPSTGHGFSSGDDVTFQGTTNYDSGYTLDAATTANEMVITETYTAETFAGTETVFGEGRGSQDRPKPRFILPTTDRLLLMHITHGSDAERIRAGSEALTNEDLCWFTGKADITYISTENSGENTDTYYGVNAWDEGKLSELFYLYDDLGDITGGATIDDGFVVITKRRGIYRLDVTQAPDPVAIERTLGCIAPHSIVPVGRSVYFYDSMAGISMADQTQVRQISGSVNSVLLDDDFVDLGDYVSTDPLNADEDWICSPDLSSIFEDDIYAWPAGSYDTYSETVRWVFPCRLRQRWVELVYQPKTSGFTATDLTYALGKVGTADQIRSEFHWPGGSTGLGLRREPSDPIRYAATPRDCVYAFMLGTTTPNVTLDAASVVDLGGTPNQVQFKAASHGHTANTWVTIEGTTNYDGTYLVQAAAASTFNVISKYVAETLAGTETAKKATYAMTYHVSDAEGSSGYGFLHLDEPRFRTAAIALADRSIITKIDGIKAVYSKRRAAQDFAPELDLEYHVTVHSKLESGPKPSAATEVEIDVDSSTKFVDANGFYTLDGADGVYHLIEVRFSADPFEMGLPVEFPTSTSAVLVEIEAFEVLFTVQSGES